MAEEDRYDAIAVALHAILQELGEHPETDSAKLGEMAVKRLYEEYPDLTLKELDAIGHVYGPTEH